MKFITRAAAILVLLMGQGCTFLSTGKSSYEQYCIRTASSFQATPVNVQLDQTLMPFNGLDAGAWALAALPDGNLVVGGDFTFAGSIPARHVARWKTDTRTWEALGEGLPDPVHELVATASGRLYALTRVNPGNSKQPALQIYQWKEPNWLPLPAFFVGETIDPQQVQAMVWDGGEGFFLGGSMTAVAGMAANGLIHWDGQAWLPLKGDFPGNGLFMAHALALSPEGHLLAAGRLKTYTQDQTGVVMSWDGASWSPLGQALPAPVDSLAASRDGRLTALVNNSNQSWVNYSFSPDTQQWVMDAQGFPLAELQFNFIKQNNYGTLDVAVKPGGLPPEEVTAWDGNFWQVDYPFTLSTPGFLRVYVLGGKVYVVGQFDQIGGVAAENIAAWDGKTWSSLVPGRYPLSGIGGAVASLVLDHDGNLIAGGAFQTAGGSLAANIARWDGSAWAQLADGLNGPVTALAVNQQGQIYAGGQFLLPDGRQAVSLAQLDPGSGTWKYLTGWGDYGGGSVAELAFAPDGTLYVAGFGEIQQKFGYYVAAWNGQAWQVLPGPFNSDIVTLLVDHQGNLYTGGVFRTAAGIRMNGLARWDGQAGRWVNLGAGLGVISPADLGINSLLESPDGGIIVSGNFNRANGQPACNIARLQPGVRAGKDHWEELAGGLSWANPMVYGPDGSLYVATSLSRSDGDYDHPLAVLPPGGTAWHLVRIIGSKDLSVSAAALIFDAHGGLVVAGQFNQVDGLPAQNIAFLKVEEK